MKLSGVHTALITPFNEDESVSYEGLKQNILYQINSGVEGILALGTTGESPTLTDEEKENIIKASVEIAKDKVHIMVGTGTNSTATTIKNTQTAQSLNADSALVVTPYYNKPSQEGIYRHFKSVIDNTDIPIMIYNIPGRCVKNIETETLQRIAQLPRVLGVKEASGIMEQISDVVMQISLNQPDFSLMSGDDALTLPVMSLGGNGVISVVSNLVPSQLIALIKAVEASNLKEAQSHYRYLEPIFKAAFIDSNPQPIKAAMQMCSMPSGPCRSPLCDLSPNNLEYIEDTLKQMKLI